MKRAALLRILRIMLIPLLIRETIQRRRVTIIFYHDPSPKTLRTHLAALRTYNFISLRQFVEAHRLRRLHSLPPKSLVITLDDGHAGNAGLKPLLEELGVPVSIFLCSGIVGTGRRFWFQHIPEAADVESMKRVSDAMRLERLQAVGFDEELEVSARDALSKSEIEELSVFVDFQSHTVTHPVLPYCTSEKAEQEIFQSKQDLEHSYGFEVYALSYPNGDYSDREIGLAKLAGYRCALTADVGFNSNRTDPFRLKRIGIDDRDGVNELLIKTCGLWGGIKNFLSETAYGYTPSPSSEASRSLQP